MALDIDNLEHAEYGAVLNWQIMQQIEALEKAGFSLVSQLSVLNFDLQIDGQEMLQFSDIRKRLNTAFDYAEMCVRERNHWQNSIIPNTDYTYISLGYDCLPRTWAAKYGIISSRSQGRVSTPFDLSVHPVKSVIKLIETEFAPYFDANNYATREDGLIILKEPNVVFNHDRDPVLRENNYEGMISVNRRRVENFYKYLNNDHVLFVFNALLHEIAELPSLESILLERFPNSTGLFICMSDLDSVTPPDLKKFKWLYHKKPTPSYVWYDVKDYTSREARLMEAAFIKAIKKLI